MLALVAALALMAAGCADLENGGNGPKDKGTPVGETPEVNPEVAEYYPLAPGTVWKYELTKTETGEKFEETTIMEKPEEKFGRKCHVIKENGPQGTKKTYLAVDGSDIYVVAKTEGAFKVLVKLDPPIHLVTIPMKVGEKWESKCLASAAFISEKVSVQYNVIASARTTVPAGTFDCYIVHMQQTAGDKTKNRLLWYSPGIGMIKYSGGDYDKELSEFIQPGATTEKPGATEDTTEKH